MKKGQDFGSLPAVQRVRFRHSAKVSHRIWQSFDKGRSLFPKDASAELAEQAKLLMTFTNHQLERAWQRLAEWHTDSLTEMQRESAIADSGLALVDHAVLNWDGLDVERDEGRMRSQLQMVLEQVRYRLAAYG
jgi:EAL domain-containing protein (putative c-di-GMP-specific phosphodiesterase class I)